MQRHHYFKCLATAAMALTLGTGAWAQAFPSKAVHLVLGAPAGSAPDSAARIVGEKLGAIWGQSVIIENRPGVGGTIAMEYVKAAPADGYTLMFAHAGAVLVTPRFLKAAKYDPINDFTSLGVVADSPMLIVSGNDVAQKTVPELIKYAKANPGKLTVGSTEQATLPYLVGHGIAQATGTTYLHVPFNQPSQAMQGLVNGDVQYYIDGVAPLLPLIKTGRIRAVAATTDRVLPGLEGIPLVKDTVPGYVAVGWFALLGPKGLPADVAAKINHDLNQVLTQEELATRMRAVSMFPNPKSLADTTTFLKAEVDKWAAVIRKVGIEPM